MLERSQVDFPMWRKKVDSTLLKSAWTPIPKWLFKFWDIEASFSQIRSKKDPEATAYILFDKITYIGQVSKVKHSSGYQYRLYFEDSLVEKLRTIYLMSFMRSIEAELSDSSNREIEKEISFWEFIDIEFDTDNKQFLFNAHFPVKPQFPNLFQHLVNSAPLKRMSAEVLEKDTLSIHKQDWNKWDNYKFEIGTYNVIYMLLDDVNKLIYVGEAKDMVKRFNAHHSGKKSWTHYKYNVLPDSLAPYRVSIERMLIRDLACLLDNEQSINSMKISEYRLTNLKIDK